MGAEWVVGPFPVSFAISAMAHSTSEATTEVSPTHGSILVQLRDEVCALKQEIQDLKSMVRSLVKTEAVRISSSFFPYQLVFVGQLFLCFRSLGALLAPFHIPRFLSSIHPLPYDGI